jgi:hypothetical protein
MPLLMAVIALAAVVGLAVARLGSMVHRSQQAHIAADAAALAGTIGGRADAASVAFRNGGSLVSFRVEADDVVVEVMVNGQTARARATRAP